MLGRFISPALIHSIPIKKHQNETIQVCWV